jgi:hypothetical protein
MLKLNVNFDYYPEKPGQPGYRDYYDRRFISETVALDSLVTPSYSANIIRDGFKPPTGAVMGRWTSTSNFIGAEVHGRYWVVYIDFPEPGRWQELVNPVGLFYDSTSDTTPFLTLYDFSPQSSEPRYHGRSGELDNRKPMPLQTWLKWHPDNS